MWIATTIGFFSVVKKDDTYNVRARVRNDLTRLKKATGVRAPILKYDLADYRYRILISKKDFALVMLALSELVSYPNFKTAVKQSGHQAPKLHAYHELWHGLHDLQLSEEIKAPRCLCANGINWLCEIHGQPRPERTLKYHPYL